MLNHETGYRQPTGLSLLDISVDGNRLSRQASLIKRLYPHFFCKAPGSEHALDSIFTEFSQLLRAYTDRCVGLHAQEQVSEESVQALESCRSRLSTELNVILTKARTSLQGEQQELARKIASTGRIKGPQAIRAIVKELVASTTQTIDGITHGFNAWEASSRTHVNNLSKRTWIPPSQSNGSTAGSEQKRWRVLAMRSPDLAKYRPKQIPTLPKTRSTECSSNKPIGAVEFHIGEWQKKQPPIEIQWPAFKQDLDRLERRLATSPLRREAHWHPGQILWNQIENGISQAYGKLFREYSELTRLRTWQLSFIRTEQTRLDHSLEDFQGVSKLFYATNLYEQEKAIEEEYFSQVENRMKEFAFVLRSALGHVLHQNAQYIDDGCSRYVASQNENASVFCQEAVLSLRQELLHSLKKAETSIDEASITFRDQLPAFSKDPTARKSKKTGLMDQDSKAALTLLFSQIKDLARAILTTDTAPRPNHSPRQDFQQLKSSFSWLSSSDIKKVRQQYDLHCSEMEAILDAREQLVLARKKEVSCYIRARMKMNSEVWKVRISESTFQNTLDAKRRHIETLTSSLRTRIRKELVDEAYVVMPSASQIRDDGVEWVRELERQVATIMRDLENQVAEIKAAQDRLDGTLSAIRREWQYQTENLRSDWLGRLDSMKGLPDWAKTLLSRRKTTTEPSVDPAVCETFDEGLADLHSGVSKCTDELLNMIETVCCNMIVRRLVKTLREFPSLLTFQQDLELLVNVAFPSALQDVLRQDAERCRKFREISRNMTSALVDRTETIGQEWMDNVKQRLITLVLGG